jgi:hypothetical protein
MDPTPSGGSDGDVTTGASIPRPSGTFSDSGEEWKGQTPAEPYDPSAPSATAAPTEASTVEGAHLSPAGPRSGQDTAELDTARSGDATIRGVARGVQIQKSDDDVDRLVFRIDRYDVNGNRLQPAGIELYGYRGGLITDGDEVEVVGRWHDGTLRARHLTNRTTGAQLKGWPRWLKAAVIAGGLGIFVAWILIMFLVLP